MRESGYFQVADECSIPKIDTILRLVTEATGMRVAAVGRLDGDRWVACAIRDEVGTGLRPGSLLPLESTF